MTWKTCGGFACACASRSAGIAVLGEFPPLDPFPPFDELRAMLDAGKESEIATTRNATKPLPPLPQSALARASFPVPREPQSAFPRVSGVLPLNSCRIVIALSLRAVARPQLPHLRVEAFCLRSGSGPT